jgi:hypothetical protein
MADAAMPTVPDHEDRMAAAREWAQWHLGYSSWADQIVNAYLDPGLARAELRASKSKYDEPAAASSSKENS